MYRTPEELKTWLILKVGAKLGTIRSGSGTVPAIFIGDYQGLDWAVKGVLCKIMPVPTSNTPQDVTGGVYSVEPYQIEFIQFEQQNSRTINEIWNILKAEKGRKSFLYSPVNFRDGTLEKLIMTFASQGLFLD
jgi:hypothetical protein